MVRIKTVPYIKIKILYKAGLKYYKVITEIK
jgi:hypothetical protein